METTFEVFNDLTEEQKFLVISHYLETDTYPDAWWDNARAILTTGHYTLTLQMIADWYLDQLTGNDPEFTTDEHGNGEFRFVATP